MGNKSQRSRLPAHPLPATDFQQQVLPITECQTTWYRLNPSSYDSALYFDRSGMGRYDGLSQSYGILYVAEAVEGAFIESFGRSHGAKGVAEADLRNEKLGFKIREAQVKKVPYMLVSGKNEMAEEKVSVRHRSEGDLGSKSVNEFLEFLKREKKPY